VIALPIAYEFMQDLRGFVIPARVYSSPLKVIEASDPTPMIGRSRKKGLHLLVGVLLW
jgi:hypothetical protein